jgi:hypothetical protein
MTARQAGNLCSPSPARSSILAGGIEAMARFSQHDSAVALRIRLQGLPADKVRRMPRVRSSLRFSNDAISILPVLPATERAIRLSEWLDARNRRFRSESLWIQCGWHSIPSCESTFNGSPLYDAILLATKPRSAYLQSTVKLSWDTVTVPSALIATCMVS